MIFIQKYFRHPKCFGTFLIEEKYLFSDFVYDLEIADTFENAIPDSSIRFEKFPLKKSGF